jgi:hypothetical protein
MALEGSVNLRIVAGPDGPINFNPWTKKYFSWPPRVGTCRVHELGDEHFLCTRTELAGDLVICSGCCPAFQYRYPGTIPCTKKRSQ